MKSEGALCSKMKTHDPSFNLALDCASDDDTERFFAWVARRAGPSGPLRLVLCCVAGRHRHTKVATDVPVENAQTGPTPWASRH